MSIKRTAVPTAVVRNTEIFELHEIKEFATEDLVRKKLFKCSQLWAEIACYEPGQATVLHHHPYEEEAIYVVEGTANMQVDGEEVVVPEGGIARFPPGTKHDVRNLKGSRLLIMFIKIPTGLAKLATER